MLLQRNYRSAAMLLQCSATCCCNAAATKLSQCNLLPSQCNYHSPITGLQCNLLQSQCVLIIFDPMPRKPKSNGQYHTFILYALKWGVHSCTVSLLRCSLQLSGFCKLMRLLQWLCNRCISSHPTPWHHHFHYYPSLQHCRDHLSSDHLPLSFWSLVPFCRFWTRQ